MEGESLLLEDVRRIVQSDASIYPSDNVDVKRKHIELVLKLDLITLLADPQGKLEGFLISYRSLAGRDLDRRRVEQVGDTVSVEVVWLRPDLRGSGAALRRLIRAALRKNRERFAGAEKLLFHRQKDGARPRWHDYPRFAH